MYYCSRWPRILRYGITAARLLGLRDRIPPVRVCLSHVSVVCCQVGRSLVQRIPTESGVSGCDLETSTMRRPGPTRTVEPLKPLYVVVIRFVAVSNHETS